VSFQTCITYIFKNITFASVNIMEVIEDQNYIKPNDFMDQKNLIV